MRFVISPSPNQLPGMSHVDTTINKNNAINEQAQRKREGRRKERRREIRKRQREREREREKFAH